MIDYTFTRQNPFPAFVAHHRLLLAACGGVSQQDAEATGCGARPPAAGEAATTEALRSSVEATVRAEAAATAEATNNAAVTPEADASAEPETTQSLPMIRRRFPHRQFYHSGCAQWRNGLSGDVFTFEGLQIDPERQVFQDSIVFLVNGVHVDGGPDVEGEGVLDLRFTVAEQNGDIVHTTTVTDPLYCAFGVIRIHAQSGTLPKTAIVGLMAHWCVADVRRLSKVVASIQTIRRFGHILSTSALPDFAQGQPNTARITGITLDSTYYVVAFETVGFTPTWGHSTSTSF